MQSLNLRCLFFIFISYCIFGVTIRMKHSARLLERYSLSAKIVQILSFQKKWVLSYTSSDFFFHPKVVASLLSKNRTIFSFLNTSLQLAYCALLHTV